MLKKTKGDLSSVVGHEVGCSYAVVCGFVLRNQRLLSLFILAIVHRGCCEKTLWKSRNHQEYFVKPEARTRSLSYRALRHIWAGKKWGNRRLQ